MDTRHGSIGAGLHHSQELEMHEAVTRCLHLPRPLRTRLVAPATLKPPTHQGLSKRLLTPLLDSGSTSYRYFSSHISLMVMVVPILQPYKSSGYPRWYLAD